MHSGVAKARLWQQSLLSPLLLHSHVFHDFHIEAGCEWISFADDRHMYAFDGYSPVPDLKFEQAAPVVRQLRGVFGAY